MGTSRSKPDSAQGSPLIPSWAGGGGSGGGAGSGGGGAAPLQITTPPRKFAGFRTRLGKFAASGDRSQAKAALGHWTRTAKGGAGAGTQRVGKALKTASKVIAGLARAAANQPPAEKSLDIRSLKGLPREEVISKIVDGFCKPGTLDDDSVRIAVGEAVATALDDSDVFSPETLNELVIEEATLALVAELVFLNVAGDVGDSLKAADNPLQAVQRENDIRSIIKEVTNHVGAPLLKDLGQKISESAINSTLSKVTEAVHKEMESWE